MKNKYTILDDPNHAQFDIESLHNGDIGVEVLSFKERNAKGDDIIELGLEIFWVSHEDDDIHVGKHFNYPIFLGEKSAVTVSILKRVFRNAGFDVNNWQQGGLPLSTALPGVLKLLALKHVPMIGKIERRKTENNPERAFFNFSKILRVDPVSGERYDDALEDNISNETVLEAYNTAVEGESAASVI